MDPHRLSERLRAGRSPRLVASVLTLAALVLAAATISWASGDRWVHVETPSMGTAAPVGSLLRVSPVRAGDVEPGDLVTFRAPSGSGRVYTHRVTRAHDDGGLTTAGDLSGADPWRISQPDLIGRVTAVWPGVGWLVKLLPSLLGMLAVVALAAARVRRPLRLPLAMLGASTAVGVALALHHPLTGAQELAFERVAGGARASWVNTGLLPMELSAVGGPGSSRMLPGEVARVSLASPDDDGRFVVEVVPDPPWWFWPLVLAPCFVPAVVSSWTHRRRSRAPGGRVTAPAA